MLGFAFEYPHISARRSLIAGARDLVVATADLFGKLDRVLTYVCRIFMEA